MISVLIPTRGRTKQLKDTLDNLVGMSADPRTYEIVLGVDEDDEESKAFRYHGAQGHKVVFSKRQPGVVGYFNGMKDFKGDICWVYSDENVVKTKGWDTIIRMFAEKQKSKIWMAITSDYITKGIVSVNAANHERFGFFPIITKELVNALGWVYPPYFRFWGADLNLADIVRQTGRLHELHIEVQTDHVENEYKMTMYRDDLNRLVQEGKATKDGELVLINSELDINRIKHAIRTEHECVFA